MKGEIMRFSCAVLAEVRIGDRYLLLGSRSRAKEGVFQAIPPGGAIEATQSGKNWLINNIDARKFENNGASRDLRFYASATTTPDIRAWLDRAKGFEPNAMGREWVEELGPREHGVMSEIKAATVRFKLKCRAEPLAISNRKGHQVETQYFVYIYKTLLTTQMQAFLREKAAQADNLLVLASASDIRAGTLTDGQGRVWTLLDANKWLFF